MRLSKDKDMGVLRDTEAAHRQVRKPRAEIKDYSLSHRVVMEWDTNPEAIKDRMFRLTVGDNTVILDWQEVIKAGRFI